MKEEIDAILDHNFDLEEQIVELKQQIEELKNQLEAVTSPSLGI